MTNISTLRSSHYQLLCSQLTITSFSQREKGNENVLTAVAAVALGNNIAAKNTKISADTTDTESIAVSLFPTGPLAAAEVICNQTEPRENAKNKSISNTDSSNTTTKSGLEARLGSLLMQMENRLNERFTFIETALQTQARALKGQEQQLHAISELLQQKGSSRKSEN